MKQFLQFSNKRPAAVCLIALGMCLTGHGLAEAHQNQAVFFADNADGSVAYYQETVSGKITDAQTREALPGVNILVKGTEIGSTTTITGDYELSAPSLNDTLVVSYIGYQTQEIPINGRMEIAIAMQSLMYRGDDLVVVGYGVQRRSDIAGSVSVVSAQDLEQPTFNTLQSLRGKVAGVNIFTNSGSPTGSNRVIIRGVGTINASSDPLYVVDGVVMESIEFMNPNDMESIEVLKDASATAIYGARGANGVVLITTQRGAQDGIVVGYKGDVSVGRMRNKMDVLNAEEFMEVQRIGFANVPHYSPGSPAPLFDPFDPRLFDAQGNPLYDTDWQDEATRTALSNNHQFSVQHGGDVSSIGAFLNYTDREGVFINSYMERLSLKLVYDANPREWLSVGTNITISGISENNIEEGGGGTSARRTVVEFPPIFPIQWEDGTYANATHIEGDFSFESQTNPVHLLRESDRLRKRTNLFGNTFVALQLARNLEFRTQLGIDNTLFRLQNYCPVGMFSCGGNPDGNANIENSETLYWQNENFLTFVDNFGPHRISSVLGASWQQRDYRNNSSSATGFSDDFFRYHNIGTATNPNAPGSYADDWTMTSYFTRTSYTFADTYSATLTARMDGSSRFGDNSKYGFFPSMGLAWLISNEDFLSGLTFIDHLRLRTSYGVTGNTEIGLYRSLATIGSGTALIGGGRQAISFVQRLPNPDLEWEKTSMFNIGAELNLFNETILLEADWYHKLTEDLLLDRPIPMTTGFNTITDNIGSVSNRGVDFMITTRNVRTSDFIWSTTLNFNYNKNRVESLGTEDEDIFPGPNWVSGSQTILRVGEPIGTFWGQKRLGTWGLDEAAEAAAVGRVPGEAKRTEEQMIIGNGLPDLTGSFINRFNLGNFDATVDIQVSYGADIMQQFFHSSEDRMGLTSGLSTQLYDSWTPDNQETMVQQIRHFSFSGQNSQADSHWIVDGSYIRGSLFSVGYTFNPATLASLGLSRLRMTANLENAFVIHSSDFKGYDPEATSWGGNLHGQNIFFYQYPKPRTFTFGVDVRL